MHKQITQSIVKLIQSIKSTNDLKEKLYIMVNSWLIEHIIQHDMMIEYWKQGTQIKNSSDSFEEEKPKIKNFLYQYQCEGRIHKVPYEIHLKIQYSKVQFKCKKCSTNLILCKEKTEI